MVFSVCNVRPLLPFFYSEVHALLCLPLGGSSPLEALGDPGCRGATGPTSWPGSFFPPAVRQSAFTLSGHSVFPLSRPYRCLGHSLQPWSSPRPYLRDLLFFWLPVLNCTFKTVLISFSYLIPFFFFEIRNPSHHCFDDDS